LHVIADPREEAVTIRAVRHDARRLVELLHDHLTTIIERIP